MLFSIIKKINLIILCVALSNILGCGGGSPTPPPPPPPTTPPPPPEPLFSLVLRQKTSCDPKALLPNTTVLVYDDSPMLNYNTPFTTYTTDANGKLELDLPSDSKISFSIIAETPNSGTKVYSFNELDVDNYDLTVLFYHESTLEEACACQTVEFDASVDIVTNFSGIPIPELRWGVGLKGHSLSSASSDMISFTNVELCGGQTEYPATVRFSDNEENTYYGFKEPSQDLTAPVNIGSVAVEVIKPIKEEAYGISSYMDYKGFHYFSSYTGLESSTYKIFPDFTLAKHGFRLSASIPSTYNQEVTNSGIYIDGSKVIQEQSNDGLIDWAPAFSLASYINMEVDDLTRLITISSDEIDDESNINYSYSRFKLPSGQRVRWYVYSPTSVTVSLPLVTDEVEVILIEAELEFRLSSLIKVNNVNGYREALINRRFNDKVSGVNSYQASESSIELFYLNSNVSNSNKVQSKINNFVNRNSSETYDIYYK